jgi:two-component system, sensor histidine kinase and response regulator
VSAEARRTILLIDDTPEDIAVLREVLKGDYRVQAAISREAAMRIAAGSPRPDLILLDVMMPDTDGYQLCRELKADPATRGIPVIFVTSRDAAESEAEGFAAGCVDYIAKPVNPLLVRARVRTHVELKLAREDLEKQNEILRDNVRLREEVEAINRHDLKNPLMVVMNVPRVVLADAALSEGSRALLEMVDDAGRLMLEMINSGIDTFKMEKGTYALKPVPVDVVPVLERVTASLKPLIDDKRLTTSIGFRGSADPASPFLVRGEELLIYSMLANLLRNAVEASPAEGAISVGLELDGLATIAVHNAGAIPQSIRDRFFQKLATAGKEGGTGLGAYSARLIARTLGGDIGFTTTDAEGTTITVTLPRA